MSRTPYLRVGWILLMLALPVCLWGATIRGITVTGNQFLSESDLKSRSDLFVGEPWDDEAADAALRNLLRVNDLEDARVVATPLGKDVKIEIQVREGRKVVSLKLKGNDKLSDSDLRELIKVREGSLATQALLHQSVAAIQAKYLDKGYVLSEITPTFFPGDSGQGDTLVFEVAEGKKIRVEDIQFVGNDSISEGSLRGEMETHESGLFRSGEFIREKYREDLGKVEAFYRKEGYMEARVLRDSIWYVPAAGEMYIRIWVSEGPKFFVGNLTFKDNESDTLYGPVYSRELQNKVDLGRGDVFNNETYTESTGKLYEAMLEDGRLTPEVLRQTSPRGDTLDITYAIAKGNRYKIRQIVIKGNEKTKEKVIRRELSVKPGMWYRQSLVQNSLRDAFYLNFFEDIKPNWLPLDSNTIDLELGIVEKPTGQFQIGAGYSDRDKLVGTITVGWPNLFGGGQEVNFSWEFGALRTNVSFSYTEPWLWDTPTSVSGSVYNTVSKWTSYYTETRRGGSVGIARRLFWPDRYFRVGAVYRLEDVSYSDFTSTYLTANADVAAPFNLSKVEWPERRSSMTFTVSRDDRDVPQFPTEGSYNLYQFEVAGGPLGGDLKYTKHTLTSQFYHTTFWKFVLVLKGRMGIATPHSGAEVPFAERFFLGGNATDGLVRGYEDRGISPTINGFAVGGQAMLNFNVEYRFPVVPNQVYISAFADAGNSWLSPRQLNLGDLKKSVGLGIRIVAPYIGILGFDFGYGFDYEGKGELKPHFRIGPE